MENTLVYEIRNGGSIPSGGAINIFMQNFHRNINIPDIFVPFEKNYNSFKEIPIYKTSINKNFIDWLYSFNLTFRVGRFFNSCPNQDYGLHIDGNSFQDCVKLNLVYDSSDTVMSWYKTKEGYSGKLLENSVGEPVIYYEEDKCEMLYSVPVNTNCIMTGHVIHTLRNGPNNGQFRKCYSLFLDNLKTKTRLKWDEALDIFGPMIVDH